MSVKSDAVKRWREKTKQRIIDSMGGKCCVCGYNKCQAALDLHHLNPSEKEFGMGAIRACPKNWNDIVVELRKCILVCSNCHMEIHYNVINIPDNVARFNEYYVDYKYNEMILSKRKCDVCGNLTNSWNATCSKECASKVRRNINWDSIDLIKELETSNLTNLAYKLGCSDALISKRLKKMGITLKK